MKLPRWLAVSMLGISVLVPLVFVVWCWASWPEQTMRRFVELINVGKVNEAKAMIHLSEIAENRYLTPPVAAITSDETIIKLPRTISDVLIGRQEFRLSSRLVFSVERGSVGVPRFHGTEEIHLVWTTDKDGTLWIQYVP